MFTSNFKAIKALYKILPFTCYLLLLSPYINAQVEESYRASRTKTMDLVHTRLEVSFNWEKQYLNGIAELDLTPYFFPQSEIVLDAKGMEIHSVEMLGPETSKLQHDYGNDLLIINLDKEFLRGDTLSVRIKYTAKPNELKLGGSEAITSDKGLYFINPLGLEKNKPQQIWTQGETESNSVWFPTIDSPNEKCTQEMFITVQEKFQTLSNGVLVEKKENGDGTRTDYWMMDLPHSPYLFMMTIGEFAEVKDEWQGIPLTYMVEKEYEPFAKDIFGNTPEMMTFFSELLGVAYPWPKYTQVVVRDYVSGAMENTSASLYMEAVQSTKRELLDRRRDDIIAHELFHQWFGDLVTTESWSNLTLNEGFADYAEYLWNEYKNGQDEADYNFMLSRDGYIEEANKDAKPLIRYFYDDREDMFDRHSYNKGGWVLHMLRNYVGDDAFFASLNLYLKRNAFQSVEIHDLRMAFEDVIGEDLNWFFDQWFMLPGHPVLDIEHHYQNDSLHIHVTQSQADDVHLFKLPVFIDIWVSGQKQRYPVIVEEQKETYKFPFSTKPELVVFDAEYQLLAEINHKKSDQELLYQYLNGERFIARFEAMELMEDCQDDAILKSMIDLGLKDKYHEVRMSALSHIANDVVKPKKYEPALLDLLTDTNSYVRADALSILVSATRKKHMTKVFEALNDSSYYVVGTAIQIIAEAKGEISPEVIDALKQENNVNILVALSSYFSEKGQYAEYDWYADKLTRTSGSELFYFIQYFSEMLLHAPTEQRKSAVDIFSKLAADHQNYIVRLSAYQALMLLSDLNGVENLLAKIKKSERDKRLTDIYEGL